jgi:hypothetical protein
VSTHPTLVRTVELPSREQLAEMEAEMNKRWHRGKAFHRHKATFQAASYLWIAGGKVYDVPWFDKLRDVQDDEYRRRVSGFLDMTIARQGATEHAINAASFQHALFWALTRTYITSDRPCWFRLTDALAHKLLATQMAGLQPEQDLKLPVPAFFLELPAGFLRAQDPKTGTHEVRALLVTSGDMDRASLGPKVDVWPEGPGLCVLLFGGPNADSETADDDTVHFYTTPIAAYEEIEGYLESVKDVEQLGRFEGMIGEARLSGAELRGAALRFVINFLAYLNSKGADVRHEHEEEIEKLRRKGKWVRKNEKERLKRLEDTPSWVVGTKVTIDPQLREGVRTGAGVRWTLKYRTLVRGHWRNQAHGPQLTLRRRTWIEPHVRGKDAGEKIAGHDYEVR